MTLSVNSTLLRAILLMEEVVKGEGIQTPSELGKRLNIPKPTTYRILQQLEDAGLVKRDLSGRYLMPGPRLKSMAFNTLSNSNVNVPIRAVLKRLSEQVGETCNLGVRDTHEVIYFDRVETNWPVRVQLAPGSRLPLHCTASGKLFLALMPKEQRQDLINNLTLDAYTPHTLITAAALEESLKYIERERFSTDNEEFIEGMVAVAVPVYDTANRVLASLAIHAPCMRQPLEKLTKLVPIMRKAAEEIEQILEE